MREPFLLAAILFVLQLFACQQALSEDEFDLIKQEIRQSEADFNAMLAEKGIKEAFLHFAAEEAVLVRGNQILEGKKAMSAYFDQQTLQDIHLTWKPDHIEVAEAGDMAYSFGKFQFSARDTSGQEIESEGIFRTLWKKQANGEWRYLVD